MSKIKIYTNYRERTNTHFYRYFDIVDKIPQVNEIVDESFFDWDKKVFTARNRVCKVERVDIDCEQGVSNWEEYDYYCVETIFEDLDDNGNWVQDEDWDGEVFYYAVPNGIYDNL